MTYSITESCQECGSCEIQCPTGAIKDNNGKYSIDQDLCNGCKDQPEPLCIVYCPINSLVPVQAKKGRYKAETELIATTNLFRNDKDNPFACPLIIWEACNILTMRQLLPWQPDEGGKLYYQKEVKQGQGEMGFAIVPLLENNVNLEPTKNITTIESIDIRAACLHLLYAACITTLERPWEEEFNLSDQQIEQYLGLNKRKDLTKAAKLSLIKILAQQACQIVATINWPTQGKVQGFTLEEHSIWELCEIKHHFQKDSEGSLHLTGLTFKIKAGKWTHYFLNKQAAKGGTGFYQYGMLPKFVLQTVITIWQQHEGAARLMLWLLFKLQMGKKQPVTVSTLVKIAYGEDKVKEANTQREARKRLLRKFESDLEILNHYGLKAVFDPVTYPSEIQPFWARLADLPEDAEDAIDFWINDGSNANSLTDSAPPGKWNRLMGARILSFDLPSDWEQHIAKKASKRKKNSSQRPKYKAEISLTPDEIIQARKRKNLSQRTLAEMTGKSQSWIRDLEKGRVSPKPEDQNLLRKIFNLNL